MLREAEGEAPENLTGIMNIVETIDDDDNRRSRRRMSMLKWRETSVEEVEPLTHQRRFTHDHVLDRFEEMEVAARLLATRE